MNSNTPERVSWFVLKAQTDLMERYMMSHRVMWYQLLMEREHRDA